jgi:DNA-directed RNA polymerase specialized sigma24 family protein
MIVVNAIRIVAPVPNAQATSHDVGLESTSEFHNVPHKDVAIANVLELADFERFVFLMSVLERLSDQDCSILLGCSHHEIREAHARALRLIAGSKAKGCGGQSTGVHSAPKQQILR